MMMTDKIVMTFRSRESARKFSAKIRKARPEGFSGITTPCMWHGHSLAIIVKGSFTDDQVAAIRAMKRQGV